MLWMLWKPLDLVRFKLNHLHLRHRRRLQKAESHPKAKELGISLKTIPTNTGLSNK
jgi:hypothetical protein